MRKFTWHSKSIRSIFALVIASSLVLTACTWSISMTVNPDNNKATVHISIKAAAPAGQAVAGPAGGAEASSGDQAAQPGKGSGVSDTAAVTATGSLTETAPEATAPEATASAEITPTATSTETAAAPAAVEMKVLDALQADGRFSILLDGIKSADLVNLLADGSDDFTLFAPTDEAFRRLTQNTVDELLQDRKVLIDLLLYHIGYGKRTADRLASANQVDTNLPNARLDISPGDGGALLVNGVKVVQADIPVTRGVVHAIDGVLLPPLSIADRLKYDGRFNTLARALAVAGLTDKLKSKGSYTLFAPTDQAFAALPAGTLDAWLKDPKTLAGILLYHVFQSRVSAAQISRFNTMWPLNRNATLKVAKIEGGARINTATIIVADIPATNGVIQVIDAVLIPGQP